MRSFPYRYHCYFQERQTKDVEFGFHLLLEKNHCHFIGAVDSGGIGDHAGLRQGQKIVGVNGTLIYPKTPHKEVVALIRKFSLTVTFLVASVEVVEWYKKHNESFSFDKAEYAHPPKQQVNQEVGFPLLLFNVILLAARHSSQCSKKQQSANLRRSLEEEWA